MRLSETTCGTSATVTNLSTLPTTTRKKLMVMGLLPQTSITVIRVAPLGDPLQVRIRGVNVALRKHIADQIDVEVQK